MDAMIQLIHVSKFYDRRAALSDVTLEIDKGEFVLLMGPSGAGKSTLLRMLIGAEQPDEGQILLNGMPIEIHSPTDSIQYGIGMIHQHFMLVPNLTVVENVALGLHNTAIFKLDLKDRGLKT